MELSKRKLLAYPVSSRFFNLCTKVYLCKSILRKSHLYQGLGNIYSSLYCDPMTRINMHHNFTSTSTPISELLVSTMAILKTFPSLCQKFGACERYSHQDFESQKKRVKHRKSFLTHGNCFSQAINTVLKKLLKKILKHED